MIGEPTEGILTRSMDAKLIAASASKCLFADFLSEIKPKKVFEALKHPIWVDAMQEELSFSQEEGINNDNTLSPVARMEAITIFHAFTTYINFKVFQMDVKSALLKGRLKEEVMLNNLLVLRVVNSQTMSDDKGITICQEKYTRELLKKYEISNRSLVKTYMVLPNLGPALAGKPTNETLYRGMIGSLIYLTTSWHDIQFSTCLCTRYQSNLKELHLIDVKRILKYLKDLDDDLKDESEEMFEAGEEMDEEFLQSANEETQPPYSTETPTEEPISTKYQSHSPNKDDPESFRAKKSANSLDASDSESSSFSKTFNPYDNYMPVIERKLEVQTAVKEDPTLNKKVLEAAKAYTKNLTNLTELLTLSFSTPSSSVPKLTFALTGVFVTVRERVQHTMKPSVRPKSNDTVIDITPPKEHHESPHTTPKPNSGKGIARDSDESLRKLVPASKEAHIEKEERLKKATKEVRLMLLSKPKLIKVVTEVATKAGVDPKSLQSSKGGQEFLKKQDVKLNILNREHLENLKKTKMLRKKMIDQYR
nr:hypothetical protein [Tanacetum cinerariifolium]